MPWIAAWDEAEGLRIPDGCQYHPSSSECRHCFWKKQCREQFSRVKRKRERGRIVQKRR